MSKEQTADTFPLTGLLSASEADCLTELLADLPEDAYDEEDLVSIVKGRMRGTDQSRADAEHNAWAPSDVCRNNVSGSAAAHASKTRRRLRIILVAACVSVLLLGSLGATAKYIFTSELLERFGIHNATEDLADGVVPLNIARSIGPYTITIQEAIGDSLHQWVVIETDIPAVYDENGYLIFDHGMYPGEMLEFYWDVLRTGWTEEEAENVDGGGIVFDDFYHPNFNLSTDMFNENGFLWYKVKLDVRGINESLVYLQAKLVCPSDPDYKSSQMTYINWENNYASHIFYKDMKVKTDNGTVTHVEIHPSELIIKMEGTEEFFLDSVTLRDGSVIEGGKAVKFYSGADNEPIYSDGSVADSFGYTTQDGKKHARQNYSLIESYNGFYRGGFGSFLPAGDIVGITVNGTYIRIR